MGIFGMGGGERLQVSEITGRHAVHDAPQIFQAVLDRRPSQAEHEIRIQRLGGMGIDGARRLHLLHFVENDDGAWNPRKGPMIVGERLISRQDPVRAPEPIDIQRILRRPVGRLRALELFEPRGRTRRSGRPEHRAQGEAQTPPPSFAGER
jgi:hypothetical protein